METKIIAWITFDCLGGIFLIGNIVSKVNTILDACILLILTVYFFFRSYIRLQRDAVALRKERWEQDQREMAKRVSE